MVAILLPHLYLGHGAYHLGFLVSEIIATFRRGQRLSSQRAILKSYHRRTRPHSFRFAST